MRTIISHFWNEEYLLPWWIKHHRGMFDEAVLINWGSTDRSLAEIKKHAPSRWKVINTKWKLPLESHQGFAPALDEEVMEIEGGLTGWRICLNTTEFLIGDILSIEKEGGTGQHMVGCMQMYDWNPEGKLDWFKPLWSQLWMGRDCRCTGMMNERPPRSIHAHPVAYSLGRHYWHVPTEGLNDRMAILHYANCISSPKMMERRLQIQHRLTDTDKRHYWGTQHYHPHREMTADDIRNSIEHRVGTCTDLRNAIKTLLSGSPAGDATPKCE
jgi:hypothetical protein